MSNSAKALPDACSPAELLKLILDVGKRLVGMNAEWWSREHFRPRPKPDGVLIIIDPDAEAAWHRGRAATEYRDALRLQALRLCAENPALPAPPTSTRNPVADINERLAEWCIDAWPKRSPANQRGSVVNEDAEALLVFAKQADILTVAIDRLHNEGEGPDDRVLHSTRELVIRLASDLLNHVGGLRDALSRQDLLTGDRKDALANLSQSLDFIAAVLRGSQANNWGYRITEDRAPHEVVKEWNGHWHTVRHTVINMKHWAEGMAGNDGHVNNPPSKQNRDAKGPYMPAGWFRDKFGIPASRLRAARRDGRLDAVDVGKKRECYHYSVHDAMQLWPDDGVYLPDAGD